MYFEVLKDGNGKMYTEHISCIPKKDELTAMQKAGYKFKLNGKAANVSQILQFVADSKKPVHIFDVFGA